MVAEGLEIESNAVGPEIVGQCEASVFPDGEGGEGCFERAIEVVEAVQAKDVIGKRLDGLGKPERAFHFLMQTLGGQAELLRQGQDRALAIEDLDLEGLRDGGVQACMHSGLTFQ